MAIEMGTTEIVKYFYSKGFRFKKLSFYYANNKNIAKFIYTNGADVNIYSSLGFTPLHICIKKNKYDYVKTLISLGADINAKTLEGGHTISPSIGKYYPPGTSPLKLAKIFGHTKIVKLLKKHGAKE